MKQISNNYGQFIAKTNKSNYAQYATWISNIQKRIGHAWSSMPNINLKLPSSSFEETRIPILEGRNLENEEVLLLSSLLSMAAAYKQITKVTEH